MRVFNVVTRFPKRSATFVLNKILGQYQSSEVNPQIISLFRGESDFDHDQFKPLWDIARFCDIPPGILKRLKQSIPIMFRWMIKSPSLLMRTTNILKYGSTASNLQPLFLMNYFSNVSFQSEDVIHAHFGWNGPKLAMLKEIGAIPDIPLVVSFYGSDLNVVPSQKPGIYDVLFRQADRCLGVSEFFADKLEKLGCPTEKITVHRLGVNGDYFNPDQNTDRRHNDQVKVLSIARLIECKGISFGIRAVAEALKQVPNLRYEIVGDGPRMDQLKQLVDELGVSNQIQFSGFVDRDTVKKKLATADVFLAPSVVSSTGSKEGTPTVIIEAMAMKLPVVTSDISGIPEMVDHGKTGYLEEPRDVDGIKKRLISLSENSEKRQKMSETARVKFNKQFDIKSLNKELIKIYKDVAINHG